MTRWRNILNYIMVSQGFVQTEVLVSEDGCKQLQCYFPFFVKLMFNLLQPKRWHFFIGFGLLCLASHRQRGHLEMAPPFTVPCEGCEARSLHHSHQESNSGQSLGSSLHYRCATPAPLFKGNSYIHHMQEKLFNLWFWFVRCSWRVHCSDVEFWIIYSTESMWLIDWLIHYSAFSLSKAM